MMQLGAETVFVGSGIFKSEDPSDRAKACVHAVTYYKDPAELVKASRLSKGAAMSGLDVRRLEETELLAGRGW